MFPPREKRDPKRAAETADEKVRTTARACGRHVPPARRDPNERPNQSPKASVPAIEI